MLPQTLKKQLASFHQEEDGLEAVQVVMVVAIAAVVLIAVMTLGQEVFSWLTEKWNELRGKSISYRRATIDPTSRRDVNAEALPVPIRNP